VGALHRTTARIGRVIAVAAATVTIGSSLALVGATHAVAGSSDYDFLSDVNSSRASHGLKPLAMVSDLHSLATNWSHHMASQGTISHNPNLTSQGGNWQEIGENVGVGPSESSIEQAFMNSPEHRANILNPDYTQIGIGTATAPLIDHAPQRQPDSPQLERLASKRQSGQRRCATGCSSGRGTTSDAEPRRSDADRRAPRQRDRPGPAGVGVHRNNAGPDRLSR
jgi:hypothetical protein